MVGLDFWIRWTVVCLNSTLKHRVFCKRCWFLQKLCSSRWDRTSALKNMHSTAITVALWRQKYPGIKSNYAFLHFQKFWCDIMVYSKALTWYLHIRNWYICIYILLKTKQFRNNRISIALLLILSNKLLIKILIISSPLWLFTVFRNVFVV